MMKATKEQFEALCKNCENAIGNELIGGFSEINFVDYTEFLETLKNKYPELKFTQQSYGISIDKR